MVLSELIHEQRQSVNTAIGCGVLVDILRISQIDEAKSVAAECLARLGHMKSGDYPPSFLSLPHFLIIVSEVHKHTGIIVESISSLSPSSSPPP